MGGVLTDAAYIKTFDINIYILQGVPAMKELLQEVEELRSRQLQQELAEAAEAEA